MKKLPNHKVNKNKEKELNEYKKYLEECAKNFKLTYLDLHNLTDLEMMIPAWFVKDVLRPNKMEKWFWNFFNKIEEITLAEKEDYKNILKKLKNKNGK